MTPLIVTVTVIGLIAMVILAVNLWERQQPPLTPEEEDDLQQYTREW